MSNFVDLFTYRTHKITRYPTHATVRFQHVQLSKDVVVKLGGRVQATLPRGTLLDAAIWVQPGVLALKCGFAGEVPVADMTPAYRSKLEELVKPDEVKSTA
jgi:hypothetical protein